MSANRTVTMRRSSVETAIGIASLPMVDAASISRYIAEQFEGVDVEVGSREAGSPEIAWGDTFFIYDPDRNLEGAGRFPFATIVTKDYGDFDDASDLNRPGVFRFNIGVSKETYPVALSGRRSPRLHGARCPDATPRLSAQPLGLRPQPEREDFREAQAAPGGGLRDRGQ